MEKFRYSLRARIVPLDTGYRLNRIIIFIPDWSISEEANVKSTGGCQPGLKLNAIHGIFYHNFREHLLTLMYYFYIYWGPAAHSRFHSLGIFSI